VSRQFTITPVDQTFTLSADGEIFATEVRAKSLSEGDYPSVLYFEPEDIDMSKFSKSDHSTHCPSKGNASYYDLTTSHQIHENVAWVYENPFSSASEIKGYMGFYPAIIATPN